MASYHSPDRKRKPTSWHGKLWQFLWYEDSWASFLANVILAFLIIKFILYPLIGLVLGTNLPVVAVVSESMDHGYVKTQSPPACLPLYRLCGEAITTEKDADFWRSCGEWYETHGIAQEEFAAYPFKDGFSKGDLILIKGKDPADIVQGDIIVFHSRVSPPAKPYPIIHRVVQVDATSQGVVFQTKGDHNALQITPELDPLLDETAVMQDQVIGVAYGRVPLVGWVKVGLLEILSRDAC